MVSGDICYFIEDKAYQVVGGSLLLIDINKIHKLVNSSGETFERITLVFKREFLEDLFPNNKTLDLLSTLHEIVICCDLMVLNKTLSRNYSIKWSLNLRSNLPAMNSI